MRRRRVWTSVARIGACLLPPTAWAAGPDQDAESCLAKAVSTYDVVTCQKAELAVVEARLDAAYKAALASLPDDQRAKLLAAERLWVAFRQHDCEVFYGKETGTMASIQGGDCMIGHARARIADLKAINTP